MSDGSSPSVANSTFMARPSSSPVSAPGGVGGGAGAAEGSGCASPSASARAPFVERSEATIETVIATAMNASDAQIGMW